MQIKEAGENYLETIYLILKRNGACRAIDIGNELNYSRPTISVAMRTFRENGYIQTDEHGFIILTDSGEAVARRMYERHQVLAKMLINVGVDEKTAFEDACKIEHHISDISFNKIKEYFNEKI